MIKKSFMAFALGLTFFIGTTACGGDAEEATTETEVSTEVEATSEEHSHEGEEAHSHEHEATAAAFYCPMECEGDKTYEVAGSCPVCGMDLVEKM